MFNTILKKAFKPIEISEDSHPDFFNYWAEQDFSRNEIITSNQEIERSFYVVIEGVQMIYIHDQSGEKKVIGFSFAGSFSGVYDSFIQQKKSTYFLETLTKSRMLSINLEDYNQLFIKYPEFEHWGRIAHQELLFGRVNREVELITLSAKKRYENFMQRCPEELKQVPQKYIASYLNMTAETFSRLRKN